MKCPRSLRVRENGRGFQPWVLLELHCLKKKKSEDDCSINVVAAVVSLCILL